MARKKHYDIEPLKKIDAQYKALIGERSNGKSYQAKLDCMTYAWNENRIFIYLRRYAEDIKAENTIGLLGYWHDMIINDDGKSEISDLTNGECDDFTQYQGIIYFAHTDEDGKKKRVKPMCACKALSLDEHYKSSAPVRVNVMLFEEFIAPLDKPFLPREFAIFQSVISTFFRRREGIVYMVANTTKVVCPYFTEWGIQAKHLEMGKISVFHHETQEIDQDTGKPLITTIAVEYCDNVAGTSKMFTGRSRNMIMGGEWDTRSYPHLDGRLTEFKRWYKIFLHIDDHRFIIHLITKKNDRFPFLYVHEYDKDRFDLDDKTRTVTNHFRVSRMVSGTFYEYRTKYDKLVHQLLREKRVVFDDNMTGTTFYELIKVDRGII